MLAIHELALLFQLFAEPGFPSVRLGGPLTQVTVLLSAPRRCSSIGVA